jgi:Domain of unknown function (DUF1772)
MSPSNPLDDKSMLKEWKPSYAGGFAMQGSLAVLSGLLGLVAAWLTKDWHWIVGATSILINWPYALLGMMPTNNRLKVISESDAGPTSRNMIDLGAAACHPNRTQNCCEVDLPVGSELKTRVRVNNYK